MKRLGGLSLLAILRILIGSLFVVVGGEKAIEPYQNFLYVIQHYEVFPPALENLAAHVMPWVELMIGLFLAFGLWTRQALYALAAMLVSFLFIAGQALVRGLPIDACGCFGDLISLPLKGILIFDGTLLVFTGLMLRRSKETERLSFDRYFQIQQERDG